MYNWSDQLNFQMDLKRSKQGYALIMKCSHMSKPHVFGVISTDSFIERGPVLVPGGLVHQKEIQHTKVS